MTIENTYLEMLLETHYYDKDMIRGSSDLSEPVLKNMKGIIERYHHEASHLGDNYYHQTDGSEHNFYHKDGTGNIDVFL